MNKFSALVNTDLRRAILDLLMQADGYDLNDIILRSTLPDFGHRPSRDKLHTELNWLAEQSLVTTSKVGSVMVARLTNRGVDVAEDRVVVPGVHRPLPGDEG